MSSHVTEPGVTCVVGSGRVGFVTRIRLFHLQCGLASSPDADLEAVRTSFLTARSVRPVRNGPVLVSTEQRYSHVAAMTARAANGKQFTLLFLVTGRSEELPAKTIIL